MSAAPCMAAAAGLTEDFLPAAVRRPAKTAAAAAEEKSKRSAAAPTGKPAAEGTPATPVPALPSPTAQNTAPRTPAEALPPAASGTEPSVPAEALPSAAPVADPPVPPEALPELLALVIGQAQVLGIPVSRRIAPAVRLNRRAKKRFGCCIGNARSGFVIELAAALPAAGRTVCLQTLAHEVLHTCPGCQNHGPQWKAYAAQMNAAFGYRIRRLDKPETLGVQLPPAAPPHYRWRITCQSCGRQFYRQKASPLTRRPSAYRCAGCGGRLRVEPLAEE